MTGANGYIGNAVARAFVRAGWTTYGLVRNAQSRTSLAADEIISVLGPAGDSDFIQRLQAQERTFDVIVSTTEQILDYIPHYNDTITLIRALSLASNKAGIRPLVLFTSGCKDYGTTYLDGAEALAPHTEQSSINPPPFAIHRATYVLETGNSTVTPVVRNLRIDPALVNGYLPFAHFFPSSFIRMLYLLDSSVKYIYMPFYPRVLVYQDYAPKIFDHSDLFDAVLLRPTTVYGLSGSFYSYARGFRANWVSAHSNLERLATDSIGFSVLKMALI